MSIGTSLAPDDKAGVREICEAAATVAYVRDINAVSVDGTNECELATAPCVCGAPRKLWVAGNFPGLERDQRIAVPNEERTSCETLSSRSRPWLCSV